NTGKPVFPTPSILPSGRSTDRSSADFDRLNRFIGTRRPLIRPDYDRSRVAHRFRDIRHVFRRTTEHAPSVVPSCNTFLKGRLMYQRRIAFFTSGRLAPECSADDGSRRKAMLGACVMSLVLSA